MNETVTFYPTIVPLGFFFWGPALVMVMFWAVGVWSSRQGVARVLENDWDGFTVADVDKLFAAYGEERRQRYRNRVLPADVACAVTYALVGAFLIVGLYLRGQPFWVAALCGGGWLLGGLCDIAENFAIARLLDRYPQITAAETSFASLMTRLKLVLFALGVVGALAAAYLAFRPLAA